MFMHYLSIALRNIRLAPFTSACCSGFPAQAPD